MSARFASYVVALSTCIVACPDVADGRCTDAAECADGQRCVAGRCQDASEGEAGEGEGAGDEGEGDEGEGEGDLNGCDGLTNLARTFDALDLEKWSATLTGASGGATSADGNLNISASGGSTVRVTSRVRALFADGDELSMQVVSSAGLNQGTFAMEIYDETSLLYTIGSTNGALAIGPTSFGAFDSYGIYGVRRSGDAVEIFATNDSGGTNANVSSQVPVGDPAAITVSFVLAVPGTSGALISIGALSTNAALDAGLCPISELVPLLTNGPPGPDFFPFAIGASDACSFVEGPSGLVITSAANAADVVCGYVTPLPYEPPQVTDLRFDPDSFASAGNNVLLYLQDNTRIVGARLTFQDGPDHLDCFGDQAVAFDDADVAPRGLRVARSPDGHILCSVLDGAGAETLTASALGAPPIAAFLTFAFGGTTLTASSATVQSLVVASP